MEVAEQVGVLSIPSAAGGSKYLSQKCDEIRRTPEKKSQAAERNADVVTEETGMRRVRTGTAAWLHVFAHPGTKNLTDGYNLQPFETCGSARTLTKRIPGAQ
jgi:hypothetical protein